LNTFPNGFLDTMYTLRALPASFFAEMGREGDFNNTESGELLVVPRAICNGTDCSCGESCKSRRSFIGAESYGATTIARVTETSGSELMQEFLQSDFAGEPVSEEEKAELLQQLIDLSGRLHKLRDAGFVRVRNCGRRAVIYPFQMESPSLDAEAPILEIALPDGMAR